MVKILKKWVGEADFDVIFVIYLAIGARNMCLFSFSMFVLSGVMYAWLAVRNLTGTSLPLIPVLTAAYVMTIILGAVCIDKIKRKACKRKKGSGLLLVMIAFFMITFIVTVGEFTEFILCSRK